MIMSESSSQPKHHPYLVRKSLLSAAAAVDTAEDEAIDVPSASARRRSSSPSQRHRNPFGTPGSCRPVVRFIVPEFVTAPGQVLAIVGSGPALGNWDAARAVRLSWREGHRWVANVQLEAGWHGALEFKVRGIYLYHLS